MTAVVQAKCPYCQNVLRIPVEWVNQAMRCKFCQQNFQAKGNPPAAAPGAPARQGVAPYHPYASSGQAVAQAPAVVSNDLSSFQHAMGQPATTPTRARHRRGGRGGWWMGVLLGVSVLALAAIVGVALGPQISDLFLTSPPEPNASKDDKETSKTQISDKKTDQTDPGQKLIPEEKSKPNDGKLDEKKADEKKLEEKRLEEKRLEQKRQEEKRLEEQRQEEKRLEEKRLEEKRLEEKRLEEKRLQEKKLADKKNLDKKNPPGDNPFPRRALVISVNDYLFANPLHFGNPRHGQFPGSNPREVVKQLNRYLRFPARQCADLCDRDNLSPHAPLKSVIEGTISDFLATSRDQDRIILLFAGHAVAIDKEAYLVPLEGDLTDAKTLIPLSWVYTQLRNCKARQKVLILDVCRFNPAAGTLRPGSGEMTEDFDRKLQQPPGGVQVLTACITKQQSYEFESGGLFLQALNAALIGLDPGGNQPAAVDAPHLALPMELLTERINTYLARQLERFKVQQTARLSGREPAEGAGPNPSEPMPPPVGIAPPVVPGGQPPASEVLVKVLLNEINTIPPVRGSRAVKDDSLKVSNLPWFPKGVIAEYQADSTAPKLKEAIENAVNALVKNDRLNFKEVFLGANNAAVKKQVLTEQKNPARAAFELKEALEDLKKAGEEHLGREKSKRWQANYLFTLARLESRLVYLMEYNYLLAQIRTDSTPELPPGFTGIRMGSRNKVSIPEGEVKDWVKEIRATWDKITKDHPHTPYAILAQRERMTVLGLEWRPTRR